MDAWSACQSPVLEPYVWMHGVLVSEGCLFSLCFFRRVQYQFYFAFLCTFSNEWSLISVTFVNVSELSARAQGGSDRRPSPPSGDCVTDGRIGSIAVFLGPQPCVFAALAQFH